MAADGATYHPSEAERSGARVEFETQQLAGRLNLGREELCQRLMT